MSSSNNKPLPSQYAFYPEYKKILEKLKYYHQETLGLTNYLGTNTLDKTYPKQNNVIIALLVSLHKKIDTVTKKVKSLIDR